jgi:hypothetical protein
MILSLSSETSSTASKLYLYNQAKLLARSGMEVAILMVENRKLSDPCLEKLNIEDGDFNISLHLKYIGSNFPNCNTALNTTLSYPDSNGTIVMDVFVQTKFKNENILFHRKTVQKP